MPTFSFKQYMAPKILSKRKRSTIRSNKRCEPGATGYLYTGLRTKNCQKIGESIIESVREMPIIDWHHSIMEPNIVVIENDIARPLNDIECAELADIEGFDSIHELISFFQFEYGLPYKGWQHIWGDLLDTGGQHD